MTKRASPTILFGAVVIVVLVTCMGWNARTLAADAQPRASTLVIPAHGTRGISTDPQLRVKITGPVDPTVNVTFFGRRLGSSTQADFSIAVLPDTQWYTTRGWFWIDNDATGINLPRMTNDGPETFNAQTQWIVNNRQAWNIAYVAHVGDVVETESGVQNVADPDHPDELKTLPNQWVVASRAMAFLEDPITTGLKYGIPFGVLAGNHDLTKTFDSTQFNRFFGESRFAGRSYYLQGYPAGTNDNSAVVFCAGGMKFLVINLRFAPTRDVLRWARKKLQRYRNHRAIVVSHFVLNNKNRIFGDGAKIYTALKTKPNLFLMLGGHIEAEAYRTESREGMTSVHMLVADYSARDEAHPGFRTHDTGEGLAWQGGNGWMRILKFSPTQNRIQVYTYSPTMNDGVFDLDTRSHNGQFEKDTNSQFTLDYGMGGQAARFSKIGMVADVAGNDVAAIAWPQRKAESLYEWYVTVSDGDSTQISPAWCFSTAKAP